MANENVQVARGAADTGSRASSVSATSGTSKTTIQREYYIPIDGLTDTEVQQEIQETIGSQENVVSKVQIRNKKGVLNLLVKTILLTEAKPTPPLG